MIDLKPHGHSQSCHLHSLTKALSQPVPGNMLDLPVHVPSNEDAFAVCADVCEARLVVPNHYVIAITRPPARESSLAVCAKARRTVATSSLLVYVGVTASGLPELQSSIECDPLPMCHQELVYRALTCELLRSFF